LRTVAFRGCSKCSTGFYLRSFQPLYTFYLLHKFCILLKAFFFISNQKTKFQTASEANLNIRAVFLHVLADALGSVVVIVSALANKFQTDLSLPKQVIDYIDPVLCLLLVALILATALPVVKESALILLQAVPKNIEVSALKRELQLHVPHILSVDELHIWKLSGRENIATGRVIFQSTSEYIENSARIEAFFRQRGIQSTTIQPEFSGHNSRQQADTEKTCCNQ